MPVQTNDTEVIVTRTYLTILVCTYSEIHAQYNVYDVNLIVCCMKEIHCLTKGFFDDDVN